MKDSEIYYSVGALLYCPANKENIADSVINERFGHCYSLALCLEDTINDAFVKEAEEQLIRSLKKIKDRQHNPKSPPFYLPKIFIRVRTASQIPSLVSRLHESQDVVTGFIVPKFSIHNADEYIKTIREVNMHSQSHCYYMMPIFEDTSIINPVTRNVLLMDLKNKLDSIEPYVLNIRVGGNDLCHAFGLRRRDTENIYQIRPIANILSDIITVFGQDYVVSGPVWEYYNGENWQKGLSAELEGDRRAGFIGKTSIHPNQIPWINESLKVSVQDYNDAKSILNWDNDNPSMVCGSIANNRMNEYKTHCNWAKKILFLAKIYGMKEEE